MAINRETQCTDVHGGVARVYALEYVKYSRSQITVSDNYVTDFPTVIIHDLNALNANFAENAETEDGGGVYSQSLSFQLNKILPTDDYSDFLNKDWRIIIETNNGYFRFLGLYTGMTGKYTKEEGGGLNEFNGFKMSFETKEEISAPFLTDLSGFNINNETFIPVPATDWTMWSPSGGGWFNAASNPGEYILNASFAGFNGGMFSTVEANRDFDIVLIGGNNFGTIGFTTATSYGLHNSITLGGVQRQVYIGDIVVVDPFPFSVGGEFRLEVKRRSGIVSFYATDTSNVLQLAYEHTSELNGAYNIFAYSYILNLATGIKLIKY